jgi:hypothetical protein
MHMISERCAIAAPSSDHACRRALAESWRTNADGRLVNVVDPPCVLWLRQLLGRAVLGPERQHLGHLIDIVAQWAPGRADAPVNGLIVDIGGEDVFVPVKAVRSCTSPLIAYAIVPRRGTYSEARRLGDLCLGHA